MAYELKIRGLPLVETETRAEMRKRLKDRLKIENVQNPDVRFDRLETTVDDEIKTIDENLKEIQDFLSNRKRYEAPRDQLKTRLAHYFARLRRLPNNTDDDDDLADIDALISSVRDTFNTYFSYLPLNQMNYLLANLALAQAASNPKDPLVGSSSTRQPQHDTTLNPFANPATLRSFLPLPVNPSPQTNGEEGRSKKRNPSEQVPQRIGESRRSKTEICISDSSSSESGWSSDDSRKRFRGKKDVHRSERYKPVSEWHLKYDGSDNGKSLIKFVKEVEFLAKSERMSQKELFRSAIHLFTGSARAWYMSCIENEDFSSWRELVQELKREFLSPDHDHTFETRAISRKQGPRESFQEFFLELQKLFNSLTKPLTESKKFEIVFRNLRSDYKGHAVSAEIDNLVDLKKFGRKLDATYWFKHQPQIASNDTKSRGKPSQVNEIHSKTKSNVVNRSSNASQHDSDSAAADSDVPTGMKILLAHYKPPKDGCCFNCRLDGHHARFCDRPRHKYCQNCGFHNVDTASCPYCKTQRNCSQ